MPNTVLWILASDYIDKFLEDSQSGKSELAGKSETETDPVEIADMKLNEIKDVKGHTNWWENKVFGRALYCGNKHSWT